MSKGCVLCGSKDDCELIQFKITKKDEKEEDEIPDRLVGHPHYLLWFCKLHAASARKHANLSADNALKKLKEELK